MGGSVVKERFERAEKTKILTANALDLSDWDKIVERLGSVKLLRTVNISENKFDSRIPRSFVNPLWFSTLRVLDLQKNKISDITALSSWCCGDTALIPAKTVKEKEQWALVAEKCGGAPTLPDIEAAILAGQSIKKPTQFPLETLILDDNQIAHIPPLLFQTFPNLKKLQLARNKLTHLSGTSMIFADQLLVLDLEGNAIVDMVSFSGFGASTSASSSASMVLKSSLGKLQELKLSKNKIKSFSLTDCRFAALRSIDISDQQQGHQLESVNVNVFENAPKLNDIVIVGSPNLKKIVESWKGEKAYKEWEVKHASVVDRQIAGGADAKLMH